MTLETTVTDTFDGFARTVGETTERIAVRIPAPGDTLVRRVGSVQAEALRQTGRFSASAVQTAHDVADATWSNVNSFATSTRAAVDDVVDTLQTTGRRVAGDAKQATSSIQNRAKGAADDVDRSLTRVGTRAEKAGEASADAVVDAAEGIVAAADRAVETTADAGGSDAEGPYETWTKDELYDRATELDVEGRSSMTKAQLIEALRAAS
jgi:hypothetical protein